MLELFSSWSPTFRFEKPQDLATLNHETSGGSRIRIIRLRLFAEMDLHEIQNPLPWGNGNGEMQPWIDNVGKLPRASVETVIVDLTPAPMWMIQNRPNWVRSTVMDRRCKLFLDHYVEAIPRLLEELRKWGGDAVCLELGGQVGWKSHKPIQRMLERAPQHGRREAKPVVFTGEWLRGEKWNPARLSLQHTCGRWGMPQESSSSRREYQNFHYLADHRECPERPQLDLDFLGVVRWSKKSEAYYYTQVMDGAREAQQTLVELLGFAIASKTGVSPSSLDFRPAPRYKRKFVHSLAKDLGLASESVGDESEKFVRVSEAAPRPVSPTKPAAHAQISGSERSLDHSDQAPPSYGVLDSETIRHEVGVEEEATIEEDQVFQEPVAEVVARRRNRGFCACILF